jgi:hypothetical protein
MIFTLDGEQTVMPHCHSSQIVSDELWFGEGVGMSEYVTNGGDVGRHETSATQKASVYKGGAIQTSPATDEVYVLLVIELPKVADEDGLRWRTGERAERGSELLEEGDDEGEEEEGEEGKEEEEEEEEGEAEEHLRKREEMRPALSF